MENLIRKYKPFDRLAFCIVGMILALSLVPALAFGDTGGVVDDVDIEACSEPSATYDIQNNRKAHWFKESIDSVQFTFAVNKESNVKIDYKISLTNQKSGSCLFTLYKSDGAKVCTLGTVSKSGSSTSFDGYSNLEAYVSNVSYEGDGWWSKSVTLDPGDYYIEASYLAPNARTFGIAYAGMQIIEDDNEGDSNVSDSDDSAGTVSDAGAWKHNSKGWWYEYADGSNPTGFKAIGDATYYFDGNGWMKTGWQKIDNTWYYFKSSGAMTTGWQKVSGKWYYLASDGKMQTGKQTIDGKLYFLNSSGAMRTGWVQDGSAWYYCKSSGEATTGWQKVKGTWYFMGSDYIMKTGWLDDAGKTYYLKGSGAMTKGWSKIDNTWHYFNNGGDMAKGWKKVSGKWYYLNPSDGKMATGKQTVDGKPYFFKDSGALRTGWVQDGSDWYNYTNGGVLKTNTWISGKYWVGADGVMATNAWIGDYYVDAYGCWVPSAVKDVVA